MQKFQNLRAWDKSHHLTLDLYQAAQSFPKGELSGLSGQLCRASASISTHIAAVCEPGATGGDKPAAGQPGRSIELALASACEVETELRLARDCGCVPPEQYRLLKAEVVELKELLSDWVAGQPGRYRQMEA